MAIEHINFGNGHHALIDSSEAETGNVSIFSPDYWLEKGKIEGQAKGRGTTFFINNTSRHWVLRHYRRGGLIGKLIRDKYLFSGLVKTRAFQEFSLLAKMRHLGLNVPKPVAAHVYQRGPFYQADLITERINNAHDVHFELTQAPLSADNWQAIGQAIAELHAHQVYHHDLNIRNIMRDSDGHVWIIDFDRCRIRQGNGWKQDNLDRLLRSLHKELQRTQPFHWQPDDWPHLLQGYQNASKLS